MRNIQYARSYSTALFCIAQANNMESEIYEQISVINTAINSVKEVKDLIKSPIVDKNYKAHLMQTITQRFQLIGILNNFLLLLVKNSRLNSLEYIIQNYEKLLNKANKIKVVQVLCSKAIRDDEQQQFISYLTNHFKQKISVEFKENPDIIGGVIIRYDSMLIDCSVIGVMAKIQKMILTT